MSTKIRQIDSTTFLISVAAPQPMSRPETSDMLARLDESLDAQIDDMRYCIINLDNLGSEVDGSRNRYRARLQAARKARARLRELRAAVMDMYELSNW